MKTQKEKPNITRSIRNDKNELIIFEVLKTTTKIGTGCHVVLPRDLKGKRVRVIYEKENDGKKTRKRRNG